MSEFKNLNGYDVKDNVARNRINGIYNQLENLNKVDYDDIIRVTHHFDSLVQTGVNHNDFIYNLPEGWDVDTTYIISGRYRIYSSPGYNVWLDEKMTYHSGDNPYNNVQAFYEQGFYKSDNPTTNQVWGEISILDSGMVGWEGDIELVLMKYHNQEPQE